jgi:hypothetical protein
MVAIVPLTLAACADEAPTGPALRAAAPSANVARESHRGRNDRRAALATMRRVTARYHDIEVARKDGFILLHECESRPGEGPVGTVYFHPARLMDGVVDPANPDALIYEPRRNGRLRLVGVEFAVLNTGQPAPTLLGATFQAEDEFGVYALHAWVWRRNPEGMFAESNPKVSCGAE